MEPFLDNQPPANVLILSPFDPNLARCLNWTGSEPFHEDAAIVLLKRRNYMLGLFGFLLLFCFALITAKAAGEGYFKGNPRGVLAFCVAGFVCASLTVVLFKTFLLSHIWILLEPKRIVCRREKLFRDEIQLMRTASVTEVIRYAAPHKMYVLSITSKGGYCEIATGEHATSWLTKLLGAAAGVTPSDSVNK